MVVNSADSNRQHEFSKTSWETNYNNKSLSGIEFKDSNGKIVHFVVIDNKVDGSQAAAAANNDNYTEPFRTTMHTNDDGRLVLPEKKTFDQLIQEKRRQQAILYNSSQQSNGGAASALTHRRAVNEVRRIAKQAAANSKFSKKSKKSRSSSKYSALKISSHKQQQEQHATETPSAEAGAEAEAEEALSTPSTSSSKSKTKMKPVLKRSANGKFVSNKPRHPNQYTHSLSSVGLAAACSQELPLGEAPTSISYVLSTNKRRIEGDDDSLLSTPSASTSSTQRIVTDSGDIIVASTSSGAKAVNLSPEKVAEAKTLSLKALDKKKELGNGIDTKVAKALLKSAPAGATVALPDGTLVKKSRRGGARAGAGRKRSRPYPVRPPSPASTSANRSIVAQISSPKLASSLSK